MHRTVFAGLTAPDANDDITVDGGSFVTVNPTVTDRLLQIGCVTHRHDAHAGLPEPVAQLSASVDLTGGQLEAGLTIFMGYTLTDAQGGETTLSPVVSTSTQGAIFPETSPPTASADYSGGSLPIGGYSYAFSYRDGAGGVTELQPAVFLTRAAGPASGQAILSGLSAGLGSGLVSWDAWRANEGGEYELLQTGGTEDTFIDTGMTCTDCAAQPPTKNTTNHTSDLQVKLPTGEDDPGVDLATSISLYLSTDGSFASPALQEVYPVASAGAIVDITELVLSEGFPPSVNRSIQGANKIDADSELAGPWRKAVASAAGLPTIANEDGDVREVLLDHTLRIWNAETSEWEEISGGGGSSGHIIQNPAGANMPPETHLQFAGSGVTVTDDAGHNRTVVTVTAGSITYEGPWSAEVTYEPGDVVARGGGSYLALANTKGNDPTTDEGVHWGILAVPGAAGSGGVAIVWRGAWSNITTYAEDDVVSLDGSSYISLVGENLNKNPHANPEQWGIVALAAAPFTPRGPWLVGTVYAIDDVVERAGNAYVNKTAGNTGNDPVLDTEETDWTLMVLRGAPGAAGEPGPAGLNPRGPYSSATNYKVRDAVIRNGAAYVSLVEPNKGHDPETDGGVHWLLFVARGAEGKIGPKGTAGLRWRGNYSSTTTYEPKDVVVKEGIYYVATVKVKEHAPPNTAFWEVFTGGGPQESKVWAAVSPVVGVLPGFTVQIDEFSEANQRIVGFSLHTEEGEATVTVRKNGVAIAHLTAIVAKPGEPVYVDMTALKEAGEGGKFFSAAMEPGDYIDLEITAVTEGTRLSGTLHIRHITWGD